MPSDISEDEIGELDIIAPLPNFKPIDTASENKEVEKNNLASELNPDEHSRDAKNKIEGVLLDAGSAPYLWDSNNQTNYFVTLQTNEGKKTVWGVDLERGIDQSCAQKGDKISLEFMGQELVTVKEFERDKNGLIIGEKEIEALRNTWDVEKVLQADIENADIENKNTPGKEDSAEVPSPELKNDAETLSIDRASYEALMKVVQKMNSGARFVDPEELQRVTAAMANGSVLTAGPTQGQQQVKTGTHALAEGGLSLFGGAAALAGAALKAGGKVAASVANTVSGGIDNKLETNPGTARVTVLPRISEYRVEQAEKAAKAYDEAQKKFWKSLPSVRREIEERARKTGISGEDVMEKMKPNGEMADLHQTFRAALTESGDAQNSKRAMDKALDGWVRQYGRGQEELLSREAEGNQYVETLRERLNRSQTKMQKNVANVPLFDDEDRSHLEKLQQAIERVVEKLKELSKDFVDMLRGKKSGPCDDSPRP